MIDYNTIWCTGATLTPLKMLRAVTHILSHVNVNVKQRQLASSQYPISPPRKSDKKKQGDRYHFIFYVWFSIVLNLAELWGIRDGLMLYKNMNLSAVIVQLDAMAVVQLLASPASTNLPVLPLVDDCKQLLSHIAQVQIVHCYREANSCVDSLSRIGTDQERPFILYQDPFVDLLELLSSDRSS